METIFTSYKYVLAPFNKGLRKIDVLQTVGELYVSTYHGCENAKRKCPL